MIVFSVEIGVVFISQLGDNIGVAAGVYTVSAVGEKTCAEFFKYDSVGGGHCAFHLAVNNAVDLERTFSVFEMIMPAFLHEDLFAIIKVGIENSIEINVHKVLEIFIVITCNRVKGLVGIRHRIEERMKRTFRELHERVTCREIFRAAKNGMLDDMRNTRAVFRRSLECCAESLVRVVIGDNADARTCFFVTENDAETVYIFKKLFLFFFICRDGGKIDIFH